MLHDRPVTSAPPRQVRLTRYALGGCETRVVDLPRGRRVTLPVDVVPAGWLPPHLHALELDPSGVGRPLYTEKRARPARVPLLNGRALAFRSKPKLQHGDCVSFGESVTATVLEAAEAHDEALEASLDDDAARAVYADWLEEQGDPFGLAMAGAGSDGPPPDWVLHETRLPLLEVQATWRRGLADSAELQLLDPDLFPVGLLRVLHARVFGFLRALTIQIDRARFIRGEVLPPALVEHLPVTLRELRLVLGVLEPPLKSAVAELAQAVRARCPLLVTPNEQLVTSDAARASTSMELLLMNLRARPPSGLPS